MEIVDTDLAVAVRDVVLEATAEWTRLGVFENYYRGFHRSPYQPRTATAEFKELVHKSTTNLTRLVVNTLTQRLIVDGYKESPTAAENGRPWEWWQSNGLDGRQKALYDEVGKHGYGYVLVLPGEDYPLVRPQSPRTWYAKFEDWADDHPLFAIRHDHASGDPNTWIVADDLSVRRVVMDGGRLRNVDVIAEHNLGRCPLVPFRNEFNLTGWPMGEVEPVVPIQDRLNQTVFDLLVAQTYAAAPQKWIAGLSAPTDEDGNPIIDLRAFAKTVWMDPNPDARFGSLPEANLSNIVRAIDSTLRIYGLTSQTPPHYLLGDLVNLSAEALLAADTTLAKKVQNRQAILGEAWEDTFRLAAQAAGDPDAMMDESSQVWWRDTEPRSLAQVVDALGKMAQMLAVPPEALWSMVPGITRTTLDEWRAIAARQRIRTATQPPQAPAPAPAPEPVAAPEVGVG